MNTVEEDVILCDWCEFREGIHTDTDRWACQKCAEEEGLNTNRPEVNGFHRWAR